MPLKVFSQIDDNLVRRNLSAAAIFLVNPKSLSDTYLCKFFDRKDTDDLWNKMTTDNAKKVPKKLWAALKSNDFDVQLQLTCL